VAGKLQMWVVEDEVVEEVEAGGARVGRGPRCLANQGWWRRLAYEAGDATAWAVISEPGHNIPSRH
jgi:hypothetical protein